MITYLAFLACMVPTLAAPARAKNIAYPRGTIGIPKGILPIHPEGTIGIPKGILPIHPEQTIGIPKGIMPIHPRGTIEIPENNSILRSSRC